MWRFSGSLTEHKSCRGHWTSKMMQCRCISIPGSSWIQRHFSSWWLSSLMHVGALIPTCPGPGQQSSTNSAPSSLLDAKVNVALNKVVTQSSMYNVDTPPSYAVDGDTSSTFGPGGHCSHTDNQIAPYYLIDLGDSYAISSVEIWTREKSAGVSHLSLTLVGFHRSILKCGICLQILLVGTWTLKCALVTPLIISA